MWWSLPPENSATNPVSTAAACATGAPIATVVVVTRGPVPESGPKGTEPGVICMGRAPPLLLARRRRWVGVFVLVTRAGRTRVARLLKDPEAAGAALDHPGARHSSLA